MKKCRINKLCEFCGEEFSVTPSSAKLRKHCSRQCHYNNRTINLPVWTDRQIEIINGSLLGDAHLECPQKKTHNSRFRKGQKHYNREYQDALFNELSPHSLSIKTYTKQRHIKDYHFIEIEDVVYTHTHPMFTKLRDKWYTNDLKVVPQDLKITALTLSYWFCDDGYIGDNTATLCTHGFTQDEVEFLSHLLKRDLLLTNHPRKDKKSEGGLSQYVLYIGSKHHEQFIETVKPNIPWGCMKHKLLIKEKKWKWHANQRVI
jgi:hypothetical protein